MIDDEIVEQPMPWRCSNDGQRLLWRRSSIDCPSCGPIARLPEWKASGESDTIIALPHKPPPPASNRR